jgi:hypothetical protein
MPDEQQRADAQARQFVLTTVWQGLSEVADQINAETDRIATLTVDPAAEFAGGSLGVYPVGSRPAQATTLFRFDVAIHSAGFGVRVHFVGQPAVISGQERSEERGELTIPGAGEGGPVTPQDVRDDVARRYQAVVAAQTAPDQHTCAWGTRRA